MLKNAKHRGNKMRNTVSTKASSLPCQFPVLGGLVIGQITKNNRYIVFFMSPSIEMITPSQPIFPEQQTSISSQSSEHKQDTCDNPGYNVSIY